MASTLRTLLVVLASLVIYVYRDLNSVFGQKDFEWNDAGCQLLGADLLAGGEDLALWHGGVAVVTAGDLKTTFSRGGAAAKLTGMFALNLSADAEPGAGLRRLELLGFPAAESRLAGHGLYLSNRSKKVYVVNHGDDVSQVEIFGIEGAGLADLKLRHAGRIRSPLIPLHCINDVVEGRDENEVFISVWRTDEGPEGYNKWHDFNSVLRILAYRYVTAAHGRMGVLHCTRAKGGGDWTCERSSAWNMLDANGLTISPDRTKLFVSSPVTAAIWPFRIGADGGLSARPHIPLPYPADNIEWDEASGKIYLGMIPCGMCEYPGRSPMELAALPIAELGQRPKLESLLRHDGSKLSQSSAGLRYGSKAVLGSPYHKGLLLCDL